MLFFDETELGASTNHNPHSRHCHGQHWTWQAMVSIQKQWWLEVLCIVCAFGVQTLVMQHNLTTNAVTSLVLALGWAPISLNIAFKFTSSSSVIIPPWILSSISPVAIVTVQVLINDTSFLCYFIQVKMTTTKTILKKYIWIVRKGSHL